MSESGQDHWAEWLLHRRFGGDRQEMERHLAFLAPIRDRVIDNAGIESGDTLLDLGSGDGLIAFAALDRVGPSGTVIVSDVSQDLLDHVEELAREAGVHDRCRFLQLPADDLEQIPDSSVDVVTTRSVLIYVDDKPRAFEEIYRVLKPGGRLSIYEPINSFAYPEPVDRLLGIDITPIAALAARLRSVYHHYQPPETDSMMNFDERDLVQYAERAGFAETHLELRVDIADAPAANWETYLNTAWNPQMPTLAEAMEQALTPEETEQFTAYFRPLVESGASRLALATAYLWAVKDG